MLRAKPSCAICAICAARPCRKAHWSCGSRHGGAGAAEARRQSPHHRRDGIAEACASRWYAAPADATVLIEDIADGADRDDRADDDGAGHRPARRRDRLSRRRPEEL